MNIVGLIVAWLVTSVSLFIISKLPTGVEIDDFQKAAISALVFGFLNAIVRPILTTLTLPIALIFSGFLIRLVLNMIIFGLAAALVDGFRLRWGFWSALIGSVALSIINGLIYNVVFS
ncbi:MAG: phage holin family protein [Moorea sp. SIO2B7]|nr:phage holin family protein [Moorena sp. SIO2B7]